MGVILAIVGAAIYAAFSGPGHYRLPLGGLGLAVLGVLIIIGGALMKPAGAPPKGQFKCEKCGMIFSSQSALDQHSKDKHGM